MTTEKSESNDSSSEKELPILPKLLGLSINDVSANWGTAMGEGNVYQIEGMKDIWFIEEENESTKISIKNKKFDVYSSRVGQTLVEVKDSLGDPLSEGIDDMTGDYVLNYELNDTVSALYQLKDEKAQFMKYFYIHHHVQRLLKIRNKIQVKRRSD